MNIWGMPIWALADWATIAAPIVIGGGFYFAWRQFDAIRRARMAEIILKLTKEWDSEEMEESRQALNELNNADSVRAAIEKAMKVPSKDLYPLIKVANFFDTLGVLVAEGFLDRKIAYELTGEAFDRYNMLYGGVLRDPQFRNFLKCFKKLGRLYTGVRAGLEKEKARST